MMKPTLILLFCMLLFICSTSQNNVKITGIPDSDKKRMHIDSRKLPDEIRTYIGNMIYVPTHTLSLSVTDVKYSPYSHTKEMHIDSFFISEFEVTNKQYRKFCEDTGPENLPDTMVWKQPLAYDEPYINYYFRNEYYDDYPVVGVSYRQAEQYCHWLNLKVNKQLSRYPKIKEHLILGTFTLPSKEEWEIAAKGGNELAVFPSGFQLLYADKKGQIKYCGNYLITDNNETIFGLPRKEYNSTSPVGSFLPNPYGIYDMGGNVCEWTCSLVDFNPEAIHDHVVDFMDYDHIYKGGSWVEGQNFVRIDQSRQQKVDYRSRSLGFRVMMYLPDDNW